MGAAYQCDITGKVGQGEGVVNVEAQLSPEKRLDVRVFVKTGPQTYGQGRISPEAAEKIRAAIAAIKF